MNIIELANESGLTYYGMGKDRAKFIHYLETFAALVEEAARADEREACAGLAERRLLIEENKNRIIGYNHAVKSIVEAIRARGTT